MFITEQMFMISYNIYYVSNSQHVGGLKDGKP